MYDFSYVVFVLVSDDSGGGRLTGKVKIEVRLLVKDVLVMEILNTLE